MKRPTLDMETIKRALSGMGVVFAALVFVLGSLTFFVSLFIGGGAFNIDRGKTLVDIVSSLASLFLVIAELCAIVIAIVVLHRYFRYRRPYKFVFEGFSNAAQLVEAEDKPIDINSLAQEELEHQFRIIHKRLKEYIDENKENSSEEAYKLQDELARNERDFGLFALLPDDKEAEEYSRLNKIGWYLPSRSFLPTKDFKNVINVLRHTMDSFQGPGISNLINSLEESAPKEFASIMQFVNAIIPAPVIKVICHLQWRNDGSDEVGITFEIIDSAKNKQQVLKNQTLWWKKPFSCDTQQPSKLATDVGTSTNGKDMLTEDYVKLLGPAMRWLVLLSWEYYTRKRYAREESSLSALLHLLGALYYASADHYFPVCHNFFHQCAFNCLCKAEEDKKYPGLSLPYFYLASRTYGKAHNTNGTNRYQLLLNTWDYYEKALACATEGNAPQVIQNLIRIDKAQVILELKNVQSTENRESKIDEMTDSDETRKIDEMTDSDEIQKVAALNSLKDAEEDREYCSHYLHNLGYWYADRSRSSGDQSKTLQKKASDYLIYGVIFASYQWENKDAAKAFDKHIKKFEEFQDSIFGGTDAFTYLKRTLKSVLVDEKTLPKPTDDGFQKEVEDKILSLWKQKVKEQETSKGVSDILDIQHREAIS